MAEIKIGDRVRIVDPRYYLLEESQRHGSVVGRTAGFHKVVLDDYGGDSLHFEEDQLRKISPTHKYRVRIFGIPVASITKQEVL